MIGLFRLIFLVLAITCGFLSGYFYLQLGIVFSVCLFVSAIIWWYAFFDTFKKGF